MKKYQLEKVYTSVKKCDGMNEEEYDNEGNDEEDLGKIKLILDKFTPKAFKGHVNNIRRITWDNDKAKDKKGSTNEGFAFGVLANNRYCTFNMVFFWDDKTDCYSLGKAYRPFSQFTTLSPEDSIFVGSFLKKFPPNSNLFLKE